MDVFECPCCGARIFFRNPACMACGAELVFDPQGRRFASTETSQPCANRDAIGCNWVAAGGGGRGGDLGAFCAACAMTRTSPDRGVDDNDALWAEAEGAKRWVVAGLMRWGLFTEADPHAPPVFDMLSESTAGGAAQVTMGHMEGVVTLNVAEADPAIREARRAELAERYRTMTGHVRHELGHLVFERLAQAPGFLAAFRPLFGDERDDYGAALDAHYANAADGEAPPPEGHLTDYAAAHPHEDWAETFAHHLHLVDIVDSAARVGLSSPALETAGGAGFDPYAADDAETVLNVGGELSIALNHVNRSMGLADVYPFVLTPPTREKLGFVHRWLPAAGGGAAR